MLIVHNVLPVFALMILGHVLGRYQFVNSDFYRSSDRLVYFIFFPVMLFWKIGGSGTSADIPWGMVLGVMAAVFVTYLASLLYVRMSHMSDFGVGAFSQCCYRFNGYVGLAMIMSVIGEAGIKDFAVMISVVIPFINLLAVSTLIWFSEGRFSPGAKLWLMVKAMLGNPLILGCLLGIGYSHLGVPLPGFFQNTFSLLALAALPLALMSIGHALTFDRIRHYFRPALASALMKQGLLPILGYLILKGLQVTGMPFQVALLFFALPTSPAAFILSSQLRSDANLASACIALSTLLSFVSLSAVMFI